MKFTKKLKEKYLNKIWLTYWLDPESKHRVSSDEMKKGGLVPFVSIGKIVYIDKDIVLIAHEFCNTADLGDFTVLHPSLIQKIEKVKY